MIAGKEVLKTLCVSLTLSDNCPKLSIYFHTGLVTVRVFRYGTHSCVQLITTSCATLQQATAEGGGSVRVNLVSEQEERSDQRKKEEGRRKKHTSVDIKIVEPWILLFFSHCGVLLPRVRVQHLGLLFYETFPTDLSVLFVNSRTFSAWIHKTWKQERCMWSRALRLTQLCLFDIHLKSISVDDYGQHYLFFLGWDVAFGQQMFGCDLHSCFLPIYQQMCRCSEILKLCS